VKDADPCGNRSRDRYQRGADCDPRGKLRGSRIARRNGIRGLLLGDRLPMVPIILLKRFPM